MYTETIRRNQNRHLPSPFPSLAHVQNSDPLSLMLCLGINERNDYNVNPGEFNPPHIRFRETNRTIMDDMIIAMIPILLMAFYYYGGRALMVALCSVGTCLAVDILCSFISGNKFNTRDHSSVVTGLIIALLMPAAIQYWIAAVAAVFAIMIVKLPFGGVGNNMFNPAAAGFAFAALCWPQEVFMYTPPREFLPVFGEITSKFAHSPAYLLSIAVRPSDTVIEMLYGKVNGPMGAANTLVIITCLIFLIFRKTVKWYMPASFIAAVAIYAHLFPRANLPPDQSVTFELLSGSLLFGAVFMLTDPVTSPKRPLARIIYCFLAGIVAILYRNYGNLEQGITFTIMIMNVFSPLFDSLAELINKRMRRVLIENNRSTEVP